MAELLKKIHIRTAQNLEQTAFLYSDPEEAGPDRFFVMADGAPAYGSLVSPSDPAATAARVLKNNTVWAIAERSGPDYGFALITESGSFTVPPNVRRMRITCVGGGAGFLHTPCVGSLDTGEYYTDGASGSYSYYDEQENILLHGSSGGRTSFGSLASADGAGAARLTCSMRILLYNDDEGGDWEVGRLYRVDSFAVSQGFADGRVFDYRLVNMDGAAGAALEDIYGNAAGTAGAGGWGMHNANSYKKEVLFTGGSGFRTVSTVSVEPGAVIPVTIGAGGKSVRYSSVTNRTEGTTTGYGAGSLVDGNSGQPGAILAEWGRGV